jgi:hypothetical protein
MQQSTIAEVNVEDGTYVFPDVRNKSLWSPYGHIPIAKWEEAINGEYERLRLVQHATVRGVVTGTRPLVNLGAYETHYHWFVKFCFAVGDYSSVLMFDDHCPIYCIPPDVETMVAYCNSRVGEIGMKVVDSTGKSLYLDKGGAHVFCLGGWSDPLRLDHFRAAIHAVITARLQDSSYCDACAECLQLNATDKRSNGCAFHHGRPLLMRTGDPSKDRVYLNNSIRVKKESHHKVHGAGQLLPGDVRDVLNTLVSENSIEKLQIATMLIISIHLFLRKDEISKMSMDKFYLDLTISSDVAKPPAGLNVGVKGKTDKTEVNFYIWLNNETPDLCPMRYLLVYVYCAGIKGGTLFPNWDELKTPPVSGVHVTKIAEKDLYKEVNHLWFNVLKRQTKLGTHTCRKTGYLWACLGGGDPVRDELLHEVMQAARHKTFNVAVKYLQNARSLAENIRQHGYQTRHAVRTWKTPFVGNLLENHRDLCMEDKCSTRTIYEHACHFVNNILNITPASPKHNHPAYILKQAIAYQPDETAQETLDAVLGNLAAPVALSIRTAINTITSSAMARQVAEFAALPQYTQTTINQYPMIAGITPAKRKAVEGELDDHRRGSTTATAIDLATTAAVTPTEQQGRKKKKEATNRKGVLHLMHRAGLKCRNLSKEDKLRLFILMGEEVHAAGGVPSTFVNKDRQFISRFVIPINICFWGCCGGVATEWWKVHETLRHSDWETQYKGGCVHIQEKSENAAKWLGHEYYLQLKRKEQQDIPEEE